MCRLQRGFYQHDMTGKPTTAGAATRGEQMLALRRKRMAASPPILRGGFRPFFFGGAAWALVALALWIVALSGVVSLPVAIDPLAWHRHEMLFGFVGAIVAGFLLTAVPNWTGRLPIAGWPLATLVGLWAAARLGLLWSASLGVWPAALFDVGFFVALALLAAREVTAANNRNLPVVGLVLLFGIADAADYLALLGVLLSPTVASDFAIALVVILISLIGGRIVPSFTRNWMAKRGVSEGLPTQPDRFDLVTIAATAAALLAWLAGPPETPIGIFVLIAAALQGVRLARWRGWRTVADPLVLILHIAYAWVPIGLALLGLSLAGFVPRTAAIHALTAGAMASMILAVMTRATLGHTGRELRANGATVGIYALVTGGALLRLATALGIFTYDLGIEISGLVWGGAFLLFLLAYGPILWGRRVGETE